MIAFMVIIAVDRLSKYLVLASDITQYAITPFLSLNVVMNRGISWGLFDGNSTYIFWLLTVLIMMVYGVLIKYTVTRLHNDTLLMGEALVLAGGLSNIIDRIWYGGVIDFIFLSYGRFSWPVFNVADIAIVCGIIQMLIIGLKS